MRTAGGSVTSGGDEGISASCSLRSDGSASPPQPARPRLAVAAGGGRTARGVPPGGGSSGGGPPGCGTAARLGHRVPARPGLGLPALRRTGRALATLPLSVSYLASDRVDPPAVPDDRALAVLFGRPHQAAPPSAPGFSSSTISASTTSSSPGVSDVPSAPPWAPAAFAACDWASMALPIFWLPWAAFSG